ncbi:MAG: alanine--glyoxylate aminotransferase family protein [Nitrososphaerota archaeon]|nr:alanine--glyoxylate aminotransferase family protein [Aigarchaeota archaeon]MDW8077077.1 alanine--glyoxylate aminotransferase family protein [Nitrososphaerota archaeon]
MLLVTPGPTELHERVLAAMSKQVISHRGPELQELYTSLVEKFRKLLKTDESVFVLACSATGGIECAVSNIINKGDKVLSPVFGVFSERFAEAAKFYGADITCINIKPQSAPNLELIKRTLDERTYDVALLVYNETSTGATSKDFKEIIRACKERGVLVVVDAVSAAGGLPLEVDAWGIDVCVVGSQKCYAGPPGLSIITVSEDAWYKIRSSRRPFYFDLTKYRKFYEENRETPFTPAVNLMYGMDEALNIVLEYGADRWVKRHIDFANNIYETLEKARLSLFVEKEYRSPTTISISLPNSLTDSEVLKELRVKHGVVAAGGMGSMKGSIIRIANMGNLSVKKTVKVYDAILDVMFLKVSGVDRQAIGDLEERLRKMGYQ